MRKKSKLGRNDPCWCGSGKKFKKCHLDKEREKPLPLPAAAGVVRKAFQQRMCLHPEASADACGKVISAHTIQRQGALSRLVDATGHCLTFYPAFAQKGQEPQRRGWREASTFTGFCDQHDGKTFAPIETQSFRGTEEQCFLLAYRAGATNCSRRADRIDRMSPCGKWLIAGWISNRRSWCSRCSTRSVAA